MEIGTLHFNQESWAFYCIDQFSWDHVAKKTHIIIFGPNLLWIGLPCDVDISADIMKIRRVKLHFTCDTLSVHSVENLHELNYSRILIIIAVTILVNNMDHL